MSLRSLNPILKGFRPTPVSLGLTKNFLEPQYPQLLLDKLDLKSKYPEASKSLEVVDIYSGNGYFSSMLNYDLKPKNHVMLETSMAALKSFHQLREVLNKDPYKSTDLTFDHHYLNGFKWEIYTDIVNNGIISPKTKPRNRIHDELLIFANLASCPGGEALFAQWMMCSAHQNWLQKYGRVRMIFIIPEVSARKFLSKPYSRFRNRTAIKLELFTDTKLIAINESNGTTHQPDGCDYDVNVLLKDQPIILPSYSLYPANRFAVVEVIPKENIDIDIPTLEYVTQILLFRKATPLRESLAYLGPGAEEFLIPRLGHLLHKTVRELTSDEVKEVIEQFDLWPFKPSLEEMITINREEGTDE
ncbi:mitochondrial transcription factor 1 [[Candida] jaroonii]|uniref:Mitochondrial transcription factor 1 n=1 Tax=[Candida] jaroonii TaxID=467808 RepID=A0ACA9Y0M9_9ASCO|nr:mitochondrial transcription factor 1 [[Candida] jaroonii]